MHQLDGAVWGELAEHCNPRNEHSHRNQDSIVGPARNQLGKIVEARCEPIDDSQQVEDLEVIG